ncbi:hypothetical protein BCR35DRAFT_308446 [Leucosporidium creatinivorum]|uniref:RRM domain-containing protein n=1 Tax=Leucosporidium creatinivorum TaxID=106004 RepID=A0A1Y2E7F4_9BASI|nr:hypothetical protein BCR35DRAFT_308446 [Leucosporidium creatinivorum]
MSIDLQQQMDRINLSNSNDASGAPQSQGLEVPQVRKQRSQRFTIPTSPPHSSPTKSRSPAPPIPSLPYQPPPPPVQSQSIVGGDPYYSFNRNPPIERSTSTETPVSGPPYLAPGQAAEEGYGSQLGGFGLPAQQPQYQPYHPQPISQHSYPTSPSSYAQNYSAPPSGGGGYAGGGYQRGGRQEQSNGGGGGGMRSGLPTEWMRQPSQTQQQQYEQPSFQTGYAALMGRPLPEDEVIPTAIVIKNIPFQVPKEQLLGVMEDLRLPPPFAFNYHFDNGQFRGLAFANFRAASDAALTVSALNGFDLQGRKLRTEFKKVLKEGEKERIERDKAIKRMRSTRELGSQPHHQLDSMGPPPGWNRREASAPEGGGGGDEEDYGRLVQGQFSTFGSAGGSGSSGVGAVGSARSFGAREYVPAPVESVYAQGGGNGYSASPPSDVGTSISARMANSTSGSGSEASGSGGKGSDLDLNDPQNLTIYTSIAQFKSDPLRDEFAFSKSLSAALRRTVHQSAKMLDLGHRSVGLEEERYVVVFKKGAGAAGQPTISAPEGMQKSLRHSASTLGRSTSRDLLSSYLSPDSYSSSSSSLLRGKKSMPDIRGPGFASSTSYSNGLSSYGSSSGSGSYPSHQHQPPHHSANQRRSNMNLREGYATVGTAARGSSRPSVQGIFQASNFFEGGSPSSSAAQPPASATQYYSSDASSSPSLSLGAGTNPESSATSEEGSLGGGGAQGQGFAVRQPRGPSEEQRGFVGAAQGSWRGAGSPAER